MDLIDHFLLISTGYAVWTCPSCLCQSVVEVQVDLADCCLLISTDCAVWLYRPIFEEVHQEEVLVDYLMAMVPKDHPRESYP